MPGRVFGTHRQDRLEPVNKRLAGGCHLTRQIEQEIERAGFTIDTLDTYYFKSEPKPFGYTFEGRTIKTETRKHPGRPEGLALARPV